MACFLMKPQLTAAEISARDNALAVLERKLAAKEVTVVVGSNGAVAFRGWTEADRNGLADVCVFRALSSKNSPELRRAVARAEGLAGRRIDARQVASGTHSHDGGKTFHHGH